MRATAFLASVLTLFTAVSLPAAAAPVTLRVFEWEGYISPFAADFEAYAKSKGVEVKLDFIRDAAGKQRLITSADDIFQAVRGGDCDVVTPTNNYYKDSDGKLLKLLAPIDVALLSNYGDLVESLRKADYADDGGRKYAVPLLGGGYSLAYNADRVKTAPTSWAALADPAFKGRTSITNTQYEANVYVAAILSGTAPAAVYDWNGIDPDKVMERLKGITANVRAYWDSNPDLVLMEKDLDLITDYGFGVALANQKGQNWRFATPKEPTTVWLDNISLAASAVATPEMKAAAHLLLDFMISAATQARIAELYGVVVPNPKALDAAAVDKKALVRVGTDAFYKPELLWQPLDRRTRNGFKMLFDKAADGAPKAN